MRLSAVANPCGCGCPRLPKAERGQQRGRGVPYGRGARPSGNRGARPSGNRLIDGEGCNWQ